MISEYAEALAGRLGFDPVLSRCVRQEVEDHLREAVAADASGNALEAERRAIANFGDPRVIAAQFAAQSLAGRVRKISVTVLLVIASAFLAMQTRLAWYDLTQWGLCENLVELCNAVSLVDRSSFLLAIGGAIAGWVCRKQLHRFSVVCRIAAGGLIVSVICDGVLTALRLSGWEFSADFLIPIFSMAIEVACAAVLVFHIRGIAQRMASTAVLTR